MATSVDLRAVSDKRSDDGEPQARDTRLDYLRRQEVLVTKRARVSKWLGRPGAFFLLSAFLLLGVGFLVKAPAGEGRVADTIQYACLALGVVGVIVLGIQSTQHEKYDREIGLIEKIVQVLDERMTHEELALESMDLDNLLRNNHNLLKKYHAISTEQAQAAFRTAKSVIAAAAAVFLLACVLALRSETVIGISLAGAAVLSSGVGGWVARTFLESYRISVGQAASYFREPMVQSYLLAAHQIAKKMETPEARDAGLSKVMDGFLAAGLETARSQPAIGQAPTGHL